MSAQERELERSLGYALLKPAAGAVRKAMDRLDAADASLD